MAGRCLSGSRQTVNIFMCCLLRLGLLNGAQVWADARMGYPVSMDASTCTEEEFAAEQAGSVSSGTQVTNECMKKG